MKEPLQLDHHNLSGGVAHHGCVAPVTEAAHPGCAAPTIEVAQHQCDNLSSIAIEWSGRFLGKFNTKW